MSRRHPADSTADACRATAPMAASSWLAAETAIHGLNGRALCRGTCLVTTGRAAEMPTAAMLAEAAGAEAMVHRDAGGMSHVVPMAALAGDVAPAWTFRAGRRAMAPRRSAPGRHCIAA